MQFKHASLTYFKIRFNMQINYAFNTHVKTYVKMHFTKGRNKIHFQF